MVKNNASQVLVAGFEGFGEWIEGRIAGRIVDRSGGTMKGLIRGKIECRISGRIGYWTYLTAINTSSFSPSQLSKVAPSSLSAFCFNKSVISVLALVKYCIKSFRIFSLASSSSKSSMIDLCSLISEIINLANLWLLHNTLEYLMIPHCLYIHLHEKSCHVRLLTLY